MLSIFEKPMIVVESGQSNDRTFHSNLEIPDIRGCKEIHADRYKYRKEHFPKPVKPSIYELIGHNLIDHMEDTFGIFIRSLAFRRYSITVVLERESISQDNWLSVNKATRYALASLVNVIEVKYKDFSIVEYSLLTHGERLKKFIPEERRSILPAINDNSKAQFPATYYLPLSAKSADILKPYGSEYQNFVNHIGQIEGIERLDCSNRNVQLMLGGYFFSKKSFTEELNETMLHIFRKSIKNAFFLKGDHLFSCLSPEL